MSKKKILFVCMGNVIRSPLAEHLFSRLAAQAGRGDEFEVDSGGIDDWHVGELPDYRMRKVAEAHGLIYEGRARQVNQRDLRLFDLIIPMDTSNRQALYAMANSPEQKSKIHLLREYDPQGGVHASVPDPYYEGLQGFEQTYQIIERSLRGLLQSLEGQAQL